jgi:hypothetical protein
MSDPKDKRKKKKQEDTDYTDEIGGGSKDESPPLTREGFYKILHKVIKPMRSEDKNKEENK